MYEVRRGVILIAGLCVVASAHADTAPRSVTLADVIAAIPAAPGSHVAQYDIVAADRLVDAASALPDPAVRLETNRLTARLVAGATVPLPVFGTVGAARRVAAARARTARAEAVTVDRELRKRAVVAWIALARAGGERTVAETAATQSTELERIAQGRLDAGVGADVDVTIAHAASARATLAVQSALRAQEATAAELAGVLGWDPVVPMTATGALPGRDPIAIDALRESLPKHPLETVAERRAAAADAAVSQMGALRWPAVALEAQVSAFDPGTPGTDVLVAVSFELPVFAHLGDRARSLRATAAAERARVAVTHAQLAGELVAAYRRWQGAGERVTALEHDILPAQERAAQLSAQAYREGARDLASALQADRDLSAVRAEIIAAQADLAEAWAALQDAAGAELGGARAR